MRALLFIFITVLLVSCSTMKNGIKKNNKTTEKLVASLFEEKGNVFYLTSTYATFSRVWTYDKEKVEIYRLADGKIYEQRVHKKNSEILSQVPTFKELHLDLKECGYELDGDGLGFKIKTNNQTIEEDLPIEINCLKKGKYKSDFLNALVDDINTHQLWDIEPKTD